MPNPGAAAGKIPLECPRCGKTLYSSARLRPEPRLSAWGQGLMAIGVLASAILFLGTGLAIRAIGDANGVWVPGKILGPVLIVPALVPGIVIGVVAHRLPKVRRVRCWNCKWSARFPGTATWASAGASQAVATQRSSITPPAGAHPLDRVIDDADPWKECTAWAYAQIRGGRTPEDVAADLIANGWPADDVEGMIEQCRKEACYAPGVVRAVRAAGAHREIPDPIAAGPVDGGSAALLARDLIQPRQTRDARKRQGLCVQCEYNLTGNTSGICPECGTPIER